MLSLLRGDWLIALLCCVLALLAVPGEFLEPKAKGEETAREEADEHSKGLAPRPWARRFDRPAGRAIARARAHGAPPTGLSRVVHASGVAPHRRC